MKTIKMQDKDMMMQSTVIKPGADDERVAQDLVFITGTEAIIQRVRNRLKLFKNEWFYEPEEGVDWFGVFEKPFTFRKMETELYRVLSNDPEIDSIEEIKLDPDFSNRSISIDIAVKAGSDTITLTEEMQD